MKRFFQKSRDDRFALAAPRNPNLEVHTCGEPVQAAQQERARQPTAAQIPVTQPPAPAAPGSIPTAKFVSNRNRPEFRKLANQ
jgi:hypothetical protein